MRRGLRLVAESLGFVEGPRWHEGRLYVSDMHDGVVMTVDEDGDLDVVCTVEGKPSGLGFTPDDRLVIASVTDQRVLEFADGSLTERADLSGMASGPLNDMVVDERGRAYVGNFGERVADGFAATQLIRVDRDGASEVVADGLVFPNGSVITPDHGTLIVAETFARRITSFRIGSDGRLSGRREWASVARSAPGSRQPLPDGMALDAHGDVWIGDAAGSGPLLVREGVGVIACIDTGDLAVYAVALGGEDRRTLYMCAMPPFGAYDPSTRMALVLATEVETPGAGIP